MFRSQPVHAVLLALVGFLAFSIDACGATLYVSDAGTNTVIKFAPSGERSVFASGLNSPRGLVFDEFGYLYVANGSNNTVTKIAPDGSQSIFAQAGLNSPQGVAFDHLGNLFVANRGDNTIWKYDKTGAGVLFANSQFLIGNGAFGLAIDSANNVFLAGFNGVDKYTPTGVRTVFLTGNDSMNNPIGLAIDAADHLYVANYGSGTIAKFSASGAGGILAPTLPKINGSNGPYGVAVDNTDGTVYVTIWQGDIGVQKFTPAGIGSVFTGGGTLSFPTYVAVAPANVPETGTVALLACGVITGFGYRRRTPSLIKV